MRASTAFVTVIALVARLAFAVPSSQGPILARVNDECATTDDCEKNYQCVKTGGGDGMRTLFGGVPERMVCQWISGVDECQKDDDCSGEHNVCRRNDGPTSELRCAIEGLHEDCATDEDCLGDLVCGEPLLPTEPGQCSLAELEARSLLSTKLANRETARFVRALSVTDDDRIQARDAVPEDECEVDSDCDAEYDCVDQTFVPDDYEDGDELIHFKQCQSSKLYAPCESDEDCGPLTCKKLAPVQTGMFGRRAWSTCQ